MTLNKEQTNLRRHIMGVEKIMDKDRCPICGYKPDPFYVEDPQLCKHYQVMGIIRDMRMELTSRS